MEMKRSLIESFEGTESTPKNQYFIHRYNEVIEFYNTQIDTPHEQLEFLDESTLFEKITRLFSHPLFKIALVILLVFAPIVNLFIFGFLWFYFFFLKKQGTIHRKNTRKIKNPMQSYYFLPDMYQQLGKHYMKLIIKTKDLEGFTFNESLYEELKKKKSSSESITAIVYDQYFYDSFHLILKQQYKVSAWIVLSAFLISVNVLFYIAIFDLY